MKKAIKFISILILCLNSNFLVAVNCPWSTYKDIAHLKDFVTIQNRNLTQLEVQEDLACLKLLYKQVYVGTEYFLKINGKDISSFNFDIKNIQSSLDLYYELISHHKNFIDFHFRIDSYDQMWTPAYYLSDEGYPKNDPKITSFQKNENVFIFKPGSLHDQSQEQEEFLVWIFENDRPLLIDLRNNSGGQNTLANNLARTLYLKNDQIPGNLNTLKIGPLSLSGLVNEYFISATHSEENERDYYIQEGKSILDYLNIEESKGNKLTDIEIEEEQLEGMIGQRDFEYKSKIILWVNKFCSSACETFVEKLEGLSNVIVVGENTMGALHFGNPATFELPHSKLQITLPYRLEKYENDAQEGVGYAPDIYLSNDAKLEDVLQLFKNTKSPD